MSLHKNIKWRKGIALGMAVLLAFSGTACGKKKGTSNVKEKEETVTSFEKENLKMDTCVMAVGDEEVTLNEMLFYIYQLKTNYDGSLTSEVWQYNYEKGKSIEEYAKEELVNEIAQVKIICQEAQLQGYDLSEEEANEAEVNAEKYVESLPSDAKAYHLTKELVAKIYKDHALAKKMYDVVSGTIDTNVSDDEIAQKGNNPEKKSEYKEEILKEREKKQFQKEFSKWKKHYDIVASQTLLDKISFN